MEKTQSVTSQLVGERIVETHFQSANSVTTVKSCFIGSEALEDLLFDIIKLKLESADVIDSHVISSSKADSEGVIAC